MLTHLTTQSARRVARHGKLIAGFALTTVCLLAAASPAAAQLAFSPDCRNYQRIQVIAPQNAILFSKHPVPHPNGTADVFAITGANTYVIPAGANSCVVAAPPADDNYCFIARNDNTILSVGFAAIQNPGGLPACQ